MTKPKIAIACQGGGSQTAFTAGVLHALFRKLLQAHIDFDEIASWGPLPERPVLLMGAVNVLTGRLEKFVSRRHAIRVEHILASCEARSIVAPTTSIFLSSTGGKKAASSSKDGQVS